MFIHFCFLFFHFKILRFSSVSPINFNIFTNNFIISIKSSTFDTAVKHLCKHHRTNEQL